jgi:hypothetical protein
MQIEPWQIPVLAMALLALPPSVHWLVGWWRSKSASSNAPVPTGSADSSPERKAHRERLRTATLAFVTVVLLGIFVVALGAEVASVLTSVATAISALVSAVMTVQSYIALQTFRRETAEHNRPAGESEEPARAK